MMDLLFRLTENFSRGIPPKGGGRWGTGGGQWGCRLPSYAVLFCIENLMVSNRTLAAFQVCFFLLVIPYHKIIGISLKSMDHISDIPVFRKSITIILHKNSQVFSLCIHTKKLQHSFTHNLP